MPTKNGRRPLVREGERKQKTKKGLEIPVPKTEDFDRLLKKAATKRDRPGKPDAGSHRTVEQ
jgi:hypothetical protein